MTMGDSPVEFGETSMEHLVRLLLASGHYLDPTLHWRFMDRDQWVAVLSLIEYLLPSFLFLTICLVAVRRYLFAARRCFVRTPVGKILASSSTKDKGKAKASAVPANSKEAIMFCVPNMKGHYTVCKGRSITVENQFDLVG
ncbi:hypothetical protein HAX54_036898, partial [Datura stramonium]|nr:hypothetical protein [Datura stramonium]